jgi:hypothetical protein
MHLLLPTLFAFLLLSFTYAQAEDFDPTGNIATQAEKFVRIENPENLQSIKRVYIPSFMVDFVSELQYQKGLSGIEAMMGADSDVSIKLVGADTARFQEITDALYQKTVEELRASGIEVIDNAELQALPEYAELVAKGLSPLPSEQDAKAGKGLYFSAVSLPLYHMDEVSFIPTFQLFGKKKEDNFLTFGSKFSSGFSAGFAQQIEEKIARKLNATTLKVRLTVLGGQLTPDTSFWSSGKVTTRAAASFVDFVNRYAFITPDGKKARLSLKESVSTGDIGELVNTTSGGDKAMDTAKNAAVIAINVASLAARLSGVSAPGVSGAFSATSTYECRVQPEVFETKVGEFYGGIARMFAANIHNTPTAK